jgi:hypothetical protein
MVTVYYEVPCTTKPYLFLFSFWHLEIGTDNMCLIYLFVVYLTMLSQ